MLTNNSTGFVSDIPKLKGATGGLPSSSLWQIHAMEDGVVVVEETTCVCVLGICMPTGNRTNAVFDISKSKGKMLGSPPSSLCPSLAMEDGATAKCVATIGF